MISQRRLPIAYFFAVLFLSSSHAAQEAGPFFEPGQPFFHTQIEIAPAARGAEQPNFVVRGVLVPLAGTHAVGFDQELLRVASFWRVPAGQPPVTLETMAQTSYARPRNKSNTVHPIPTGPRLIQTGMHPGVSSDLNSLFVDPRPPGREGDHGRGPLPADFARFDGVEVGGASAILRYRVGGTQIREWFELQSASAETRFLRHLEIAAHAEPVHFALGAPAAANWQLQPDGSAFAKHPEAGYTRVATNSGELSLSIHHGELVATVAPGSGTQRLTLAFAFTTDETTATPGIRMESTPVPPTASSTLRWPESATSGAELESLAHNGLILDRIAVPEENPWRRRVRPADLAFLDHDRAAVVTYDGDVWLLSGLNDPELLQLTWKRFASGLHEPLAITAPGGVIQVATKNGIVRIHDRDRNGEADWYENFNDQLIQSQNTRSFALDMAMAPDGSTFITQGGIVNQSGIKSGGTGTDHSGGFLKISPDGRSSALFAKSAREPFVTVHPKTGVVTGTDQQGHYIPASAVYLIREDDAFGFLELEPEKLTPPLAWIPHDQDTSSSSQVWTMGDGLGPWSNRLLHLSYGTGRIFVISPDLTSPIPQAAIIPLDLKTELPLLHGRMHPSGENLFLAGFQIWGTRTTTWWGLGRIRRGGTPVVSAIRARSMSDGVILDFAEPVDPASLKAENVTVRAWNYRRSANYGSGRYTLDGNEGTNAIGVGQVIASNDRKSVFIHLPKLPAVMQLELRHEFRFARGPAASGVVYFTINRPRPLDLARAGFGEVDLSKSDVVINQIAEEAATPALGKTLAENLGCIVCHSTDGTMEGKVGPTWQHLFGSRRMFVDGTSEVADENYLRQKILDPMNKRVTTGPAEMPSYRGVLSESQLESLVFYIRSLRRPLPGETRPQVEGGSRPRNPAAP